MKNATSVKLPTRSFTYHCVKLIKSLNPELTENYGVTELDTKTVYIKGGYSNYFIESVVAHESAHAWREEHPEAALELNKLLKTESSYSGVYSERAGEVFANDYSKCVTGFTTDSIQSKLTCYQVESILHKNLVLKLYKTEEAILYADTLDPDTRAMLKNTLDSHYSEKKKSSAETPVFINPSELFSRIDYK